VWHATEVTHTACVVTSFLEKKWNGSKNAMRRQNLPAGINHHWGHLLGSFQAFTSWLCPQIGFPQWWFASDALNILKSKLGGWLAKLNFGVTWYVDIDYFVIYSFTLANSFVNHIFVEKFLFFVIKSIRPKIPCYLSFEQNKIVMSYLVRLKGSIIQVV
jgi:hypothetical protein